MHLTTCTTVSGRLHMCRSGKDGDETNMLAFSTTLQTGTPYTHILLRLYSIISSRMTLSYSKDELIASLRKNCFIILECVVNELLKVSRSKISGTVVQGQDTQFHADTGTHRSNFVKTDQPNGCRDGHA